MYTSKIIDKKKHNTPDKWPNYSNTQIIFWGDSRMFVEATLTHHWVWKWESITYFFKKISQTKQIKRKMYLLTLEKESTAYS